ncbi:MBL fold metallo-hydrolase [bacterium]|nr:MBL fold metallo-hydrolase [bacterium]
MVENIKWLGHASLLIEKEGKVIYVDPWKIKEEKKADLILITHPHYDHCSNEDVKKILKEETVIVAPSDALKEVDGKNKKAIRPGEGIDFEWVKIEGVAAYNLNKSFHPKANNWVGFIIRFPESSIYIAGDTDFVPEMKQVKANIVILPVGGTYTMDAEEAARAVNTIKPEIAIPIHYGDIVGSQKDAEKFASLVKEAEVKIL